MHTKLITLHDACQEARAELSCADGAWLLFVSTASPEAVLDAKHGHGEGALLWQHLQQAKAAHDEALQRFSDAHAQRPRPMRRAPLKPLLA